MFISPKSMSRIGALALLATGALSAPAMADFIGISRCNDAGGSGAAALHFVSGGDRFTVATGQGGLTNSIVMSERQAMAWAASSGLFPEDTVFGNYAGYICGMPREESRPDPEPQQPDIATDPEGPVCQVCEEQILLAD